MLNRDIVILGSSGFAKEVLWLLEENNKYEKEWNILGFIDQSYGDDAKRILGYPIIGDDTWLLQYSKEINVVCGIGSSKLREKVVQKFIGRNNIKFPSIISKNAIVSEHVKMGKGCIVCAGTIFTVDIVVGDFVTVNLNCTVGHEAVLGNYITLYPDVNVSGNVTIQAKSEVGTGSQIIQGLKIGKNTIVGAGTVVIKDLPGNCTAVGNPAKVIKKNM